MTKKLILIMLAVALLSSAATYAATNLPWTKNIYSISDNEVVDRRGSWGTQPTVSMFDYGSDRCYVTHESISCVKRGER